MPYCEGTMSHSISNGSAITIETISIHPGYWRATSASKNVMSCYVPDACRGGVTGISSYCQEGYEGPCELASAAVFLQYPKDLKVEWLKGTSYAS